MNAVERKDKSANLYFRVLLPFGIAAVLWALWGFPYSQISLPLVILSVATVFFSSRFRLQIPKTKLHVTISDALVFLSFLLYGGEVAVVLAALETTFTALNFKRQGLTIKYRTVAINVTIAAVSVWVTVLAVKAAFGSPESFIQELELSEFVKVLAVMAISQFLVNSVLVSLLAAIRTENTLWKVWNQYCLNALVLYVFGAIVAGISAIAISQFNFFVFMAVTGIFGLIYLTYRRYLDDVKSNVAQAENSERRRADEAEQHVQELEHYVRELEKSSEALKESRERFRVAAYHDELTGLPNRNQFREALDELLAGDDAGRESRIAVLFLDLNRFKTLNDSLGHSAGDQLILNVAARVTQLLHQGDLLARFSGDEFAILRHDIAGQAEVVELANTVARRIADPFPLEDRQVFTSVSIGIAFGNAKYKTADEMLRDADIAMYYAKEAQKSYVIFDRDMHDRAVSLLELETDLRFAVERKEFEIFYQPIVNLDDAGLEGFEALVRWNHPERGLVSPAEFIPVAESNGLIVPMTIDILRSACKQLRIWQMGSDENAGLMVSVNLSVKSLADPQLVRQITEVIEETDFDPAYLKLEITESGLMDNAENAILMLQHLKSIGVKLSIDDFGTGYSSLSYLHRFPIDTLKVDRSFVSTMEEGTENGEIVRTVIALAKVLKLSVVAEGIESIHQFHQLRILGCEFGQGYLFSRPLPISEINKLLEDRNRWRNILPINEFGAVARNAEYSRLRLTQ